tara:strand:+ start:660 stop:2186 length:1527 start_codon:yes stop_codon:yes gene_type:complete
VTGLFERTLAPAPGSAALLRGSLQRLLPCAAAVLLAACSAGPGLPTTANNTHQRPAVDEYADYAGERAYRTLSVPLPADTLPIALAAGEDNDVWAVAEFSNSLFHVTTSPPGVEEFEVPRRGQSPFIDAQGWRSGVAQSERVIRDSHGRLWFPQTGHWLNFSLPDDVQNYSRIVSYSPATGRFCAYPVPDNNSAVLGIAWDEARNRLWFAQSGNNALVSFNPDELRACDSYNNYDWHINDEGQLARPLPIAYCEHPGQGACMRKYELEGDNGLINQFLVQQPGDPDPGAIWYTEFLGGAIGRLHPATGEQDRFPLYRVGEIMGSRFFLRVHQIHAHPDNGDLVFSVNGTGQVVRFGLQHALQDPSHCRTLDAAGNNPCMTVMQVPVFDTAQAQLTTHSMAFDSFANLWITTWAGKCPMDLAPPGLAVIDADWTRMAFVDQLELPTPAQDGSTVTCDADGKPARAFKGIAIDQHNNVWFSNYFQGVVHKLVFARGGEEDPFPALCQEYC